MDVEFDPTRKKEHAQQDSNHDDRARAGRAVSVGDRSRRTAHRISALFREHIRTAIGTDLGVGLSQGVASLQRDGIRHGLKLLERADANLYAAKRDGKSKAVGI